MTANTKPLVAVGYNNIPRRNCVDLNHPTELSIRQAMESVEALGADQLLTEAIIKLEEAKELVSNWLEGKSAMS